MLYKNLLNVYYNIYTLTIILCFKIILILRFELLFFTGTEIITILRSLNILKFSTVLYIVFSSNSVIIKA